MYTHFCVLHFSLPLLLSRKEEMFQHVTYLSSRYFVHRLLYFHQKQHKYSTLDSWNHKLIGMEGGVVLHFGMSCFFGGWGV